MSGWAMAMLALGTVVGGAWLASALDGLCCRLAGGGSGAWIQRPWQLLVQSLSRQSFSTEAPDRINRHVAPLLYLSLGLGALALVPLGPDQVLLETPVGIVVWGAIESTTVVAVFLHGWSQNSLFPLMGGYRFVAMGLSAMLLSMFVLIGVALPAQSLALPAVVEAQQGLWNVVKQPLGLPLFLFLGLAVSLRGPLNFADSEDLAGGTSAEDTAGLYVLWQLARYVMLVSFCAVAASAFLGGYLGPLLPEPLWLLIKTAGLLILVVLAGHLLARPDASRALTVLWVVLMPLAFVDLLIGGVESLA